MPFISRQSFGEKNRLFPFIIGNYSGRKADWIPGEGGFYGVQQVHTLFADRGYITADDTKSLGSLGAAETPRYFLLNLDHAQVPLGLVVIKWNS